MVQEGKDPPKINIEKKQGKLKKLTTRKLKNKRYGKLRIKFRE